LPWATSTSAPAPRATRADSIVWTWQSTLAPAAFARATYCVGSPKENATIGTCSSRHVWKFASEFGIRQVMNPTPHRPFARARTNRICSRTHSGPPGWTPPNMPRPPASLTAAARWPLVAPEAMGAKTIGRPRPNSSVRRVFSMGLSAFSVPVLVSSLCLESPGPDAGARAVPPMFGGPVCGVTLVERNCSPSRVPGSRVCLGLSGVLPAAGLHELRGARGVGHDQRSLPGEY